MKAVLARGAAGVLGGRDGGRSSSHHRVVGVREKLAELREEVLLVLEESGHLSIHLLLCEGWCVVPTSLFSIALLLLK